MKKKIQFSIQYLKKLKLNLATIIVFELIYKLALILIFKPLVAYLFSLILRTRGISFLADENFKHFISSPITWLALLFWVLIFTFFVFFDICCVIIALHSSYYGQKLPLFRMVKEGFLATSRMFTRHNLFLAVYLLLVIPFTYAFVLTGYNGIWEIPQFVQDYIYEHLWLTLSYFGAVIFVAWRFFRWIFSLHYFILKKENYKEARASSRSLVHHYYMRSIGLMGIWTLIIFISYRILVHLSALGIVAINSKLSHFALLSSVVVSAFTVLATILELLFYALGIPLVLVGISILFYYLQEKRGEEIAPELTNLDTAYSIYDSRAIRKMRRHKKKVLAVTLIILIGGNFLISYLDKRGILKIQNTQNLVVAAHRGYSSKYPENTLEAVKGAILYNADYAEIDVQQTKDGKIIVMHDSNTKRTTGEDHDIWNTTYEELKKLDNGSWFDSRFSSVKIPTLESVLELAKGKIKLNIETKPSGHDRDLEYQVVKLIHKYHMEKEVVVSSLRYDSIRKIKQEDKNLETAYITSFSYGDFTQLKYADAYSVEGSIISSSFVSKAHRANKKVYVWTVDKESLLQSVINMNVDMIITNDPVWAKTLLYQHDRQSATLKLFNRLQEILHYSSAQ